jgi:hypothetical protein
VQVVVLDRPRDGATVQLATPLAVCRQSRRERVGVGDRQAPAVALVAILAVGAEQGQLSDQLRRLPWQHGRAALRNTGRLQRGSIGGYRELRRGIPLQEVLPQRPVVRDRDGRTPGRAGVAGQRPGVGGVDGQHLGDQIGHHRRQGREELGLVTSADPVGLEPDPTLRAIAMAHVIDSNAGPWPILRQLARRCDDEADVAA